MYKYEIYLYLGGYEGEEVIELFHEKKFSKQEFINMIAEAFLQAIPKRIKSREENCLHFLKGEAHTPESIKIKSDPKISLRSINPGKYVDLLKEMYGFEKMPIADVDADLDLGYGLFLDDKSQASGVTYTKDTKLFASLVRETIVDLVNKYYTGTWIYEGERDGYPVNIVDIPDAISFCEVSDFMKDKYNIKERVRRLPEDEDISTRRWSEYSEELEKCTKM